MEIFPREAPELLMDVMRAGLVPMLTSSPGIGKSSIAAQIADDRKLLVIDLRLAQSDPTDLNGFPAIDKNNEKAGYVPMDTFPIEGDDLPKGYSGWLLLLDEFNSAPMSVQAAAYKLVLDRKVGNKSLHGRVACMAAGNLITDNAIVNNLGTAMQSRLIHFQLAVNHKDWIEWADHADIDYRVKAFINFKPEILHKFDPAHSDQTFPCPRTWEFMSKIIKPWNIVEDKKIAVLAGTVGEGAGREFFGFCEIFGSLPDINDLILNPKTIDVPEKKDIVFAISGLISHHLDENNIDKLIEYIDRLDLEFQIITLNGAMRKDKTGLLVKTPAAKAWISKTAQHLI